MISERFLVWLEDVLAAAEVVPVTEQIVACRDPKDDKFLELAVNGRADFIVSGDADQLVLSRSVAFRLSRPPSSCGAHNSNSQGIFGIAYLYY